MILFVIYVLAVRIPYQPEEFTSVSVHTPYILENKIKYTPAPMIPTRGDMRVSLVMRTDWDGVQVISKYTTAV